MSDLKTWVVTGAGGGIGRALVEKLLERGHCVLATDIREDSLTVIADHLNEDQARRYSWQILDVTDNDAFAAVINQALKLSGKLDGLINNAGIMSSSDFVDDDLQVWRKIMDINLMGVVYGSQAAARLMVKQGYGSIINIASTAGMTPLMHATAYAASKHAVVGFTRSLREDLKSRGVDVQLVIPGLIDTGIFDRAVDGGSFSSRAMIEKVPIKKCSPEKAAEIIVDGMESHRSEIVFPLINRVILMLYRWFPGLMTRLIIKNQNY